MNKSIILYSNGCPSCNNLKLMLKKAEIEYIEKNDIEEMLTLGITQIPVLSVDGEMMSYEDAKKWVISNNKGGVR